MSSVSLTSTMFANEDLNDAAIVRASRFFLLMSEWYKQCYIINVWKGLTVAHWHVQLLQSNIRSNSFGVVCWTTLAKVQCFHKVKFLAGTAVASLVPSQMLQPVEISERTIKEQLSTQETTKFTLTFARHHCKFILFARVSGLSTVAHNL